LIHDPSGDVLAGVHGFLEVVSVAEMRGIDVLLRGPDDVSGVDVEQKSDDPGSVEADTGVVDFDEAVTTLVVSKIDQHIPQSDVAKRGPEEIKESLALVEESDNVRLVWETIITFAFLEIHGDLHVSGNTPGVADSLVIEGGSAHHDLLTERKHAINLHEIFISVEIGQRICVFWVLLVVAQEAVLVEVLTVAVVVLHQADKDTKSHELGQSQSFLGMVNDRGTVDVDLLADLLELGLLLCHCKPQLSHS